MENFKFNVNNKLNYRYLDLIELFKVIAFHSLN